MNEWTKQWMNSASHNKPRTGSQTSWLPEPSSFFMPPQPILKLTFDQNYKCPSIMYPEFSWNIHPESPWVAHLESWLFISESRTFGRPTKGILRAKAWKFWLLKQLFQVHWTKVSSCEKEHRIKTAFSPHHHLQPCIPHIMVTGRY